MIKNTVNNKVATAAQIKSPPKLKGKLLYIVEASNLDSFNNLVVHRDNPKVWGDVQMRIIQSNIHGLNVATYPITLIFPPGSKFKAPHDLWYIKHKDGPIIMREDKRHDAYAYWILAAEPITKTFYVLLVECDPYVRKVSF